MLLALSGSRHPGAWPAEVFGRSEMTRVSVQLAVEQLGITVESPEAVWPAPACDNAVAACVEKAPEGVVDFAGCGTYTQVSVCRARVSSAP